MTDRHQFDCVWKGAWYKLGSLSDHHKYEVPPTGPNWLLFDRMYRKILAPRDEVTIPANPLPR